MSRIRGRGPQADEKQTATEAALTARVTEVYRDILARTPEHDLVPSLDRIGKLLALLGDPQRAFQVVHVTGTNGKTSTTRMIERLLREHGLRTGRFTSPHLTDVRERITVDGELLSEQRFVSTYEEVLPYVGLVDKQSRENDGPPMSFFELLVAMAYAAFADTPVEVAAVEVGMGGSWDATNIADGRVAVVTPIALDHERFLGHTVEEIATEKGGIIKPGSTAVFSNQPEEAAQVLMRRAAEVGATVLREGLEFGVLNRDIALGGQMLTLAGRLDPYEEIFLPLHGEHQARNAAAALAAVEAFMGAERLSVDVVRDAFADVTSPGRLEVVRGGPTVLVDAAHNPAGAQVVAETVGEAFGFERLVGLVAVLEDKDADGILGALEPIFDEVVISRTSSARSMNVDDLADIAIDVFGEDRVHIRDRLDDALDTAIGLAEAGGQTGAGVLATGSVTMAADIRLLLHLPTQP